MIIYDRIPINGDPDDFIVTVSEDKVKFEYLYDDARAIATENSIWRLYLALQKHLGIDHDSSL